MEEFEHNFETLATKCFPGYLNDFKERMKSAINVTEFRKSTKSVLLKLFGYNLNNDFSGIYCFLDNNGPAYFGISKKVISRLKQHIVARSHYSASLAYLIAKDLEAYGGRRADFDKIERGTRELNKWKVCWMPIENPIELYLFEVYCSMEYKSTWNSFKTH